MTRPTEVILLDPRQPFDPRQHQLSYPLGYWGVHQVAGEKTPREGTSQAGFFWATAAMARPGFSIDATELTGVANSLEEAKAAARAAARRTYPPGGVLVYSHGFAREMFNAYRVLHGRSPR